MDNEFVWVIYKPTNPKAEPIDILVDEWGRFVKLIPDRPAQLPKMKAFEVVKLHGVKACENPEVYFQNRPQKICIQRDGGIGDLLLLEPVIRRMKEEKNRDLTLVTCQKEVLSGNPAIDHIELAKQKEITPVKQQDFDFWYDFRNYSEAHAARNKIHRTDIYALKNGTQLSDKNPRIYFNKDEKNNLFEKQAGKTYIGISCDGSHSYRRYDRGRDLVEHILNSFGETVVVIFGSWDFVKVDDNERIINLQGKTTVREMMLAVRDLDYLISVDTGIMHIGMSLHVPTVGIFSICSPEFRVTYYDGPKKIIRKDLPCKGCGDTHMVKCRNGDKQTSPEFIPPCLDIHPDEIFKTLMEMPKIEERRFFIAEEEVKKVNVNILPAKKLWMPIIVLNEEKNLPRFIELVMKNTAIEKVIAIDGGSADRTVELLRSAGAFVYAHPYDKNYHNQQAIQREIACSYVPENQNIFIMDIDEVFSKELSDYLPSLAEEARQYGVVYRRTFNKFEDILDISKAIKNFPDPQPRFYKWQRKFKFVNGAHHITLNTPEPFIIKHPILHYENQNGKRDELEKQWYNMMKDVRKYV